MLCHPLTHLCYLFSFLILSSILYHCWPGILSSHSRRGRLSADPTDTTWFPATDRRWITHPGRASRQRRRRDCNLQETRPSPAP
ncbi:uncharacterized protein IWZ02DRAFT_256151 [Phyllosticta citriasiana]|uniref:uncharacterized protein n=1 Tax=Phyllosticta citriasiana TaxID=595635 RepID=UPI0030FDCD7A